MICGTSKRMSKSPHPTSSFLCVPPAIYGSLEALRAENRKKVSKKSSRAFRPGVSKKSRKVSEKHHFAEGPTIKRIQSRSKFSISIERIQSRSKFSISTSRFPHKNRAAVGGSLEIFIPISLEISNFLIFGPSGFGDFSIFSGLFETLGRKAREYFLETFPRVFGLEGLELGKSNGGFSEGGIFQITDLSSNPTSQ